MASISEEGEGSPQGQHIFISYSRATDAETAAEIAQHLHNAGMDVWQDIESIPAGQAYREKIAKAVLSCRKMLFLWSRQAAERDSSWLLWERSLLLDRDPANRENRVVPVLLDDVELPRDMDLLEAIDYRSPNAVAKILESCDPSAGDDRKPPHDWSDTGLNDPPLGFWGRAQDLATLRRGILDERCRLVLVSGVAGIGKTTLVRSFLQDREARRRFVIICRSLFNSIPLPQLLGQLIAALSGQRVLPQSSDPGELAGQLFDLASSRPALIVLDNLESVFDPLSEVQRFQSAYADLEILLRRFATGAHRSCLLLTCREELRVLEPWITQAGPVRDLALRGVGAEGAREIFRARGEFRAKDRDWGALSLLYDGHPYAFKLAAGVVASAFGGDVGEFLDSEQPALDGLEELFLWHVERFTPEEREVVYWLAISRQPMPLPELQSDLLTEETRQRTAQIVDSLRQKISLEIIDRRYSLQPYLVEFMTRRLVHVVTERLIEKIVVEILLTKLNLLNTHALLKTQSSQHVRSTQRRLILRPILDSVARQLPAGQTLSGKLDEILDILRRDFPGRSSYAAGNILNLLIQLGIDLRGHDFSNLCIWQADLEGAELREVDFSGCQFAKCSFTQTFGTIQAVAFGPESDVIAAGDTSGYIHVWRLADGQLLYRIAAHENWVRRLLFTSGGRILVSAGDDHKVIVWDARTGRRRYTFEGHANWVGDLAFDEPSQVLASASEDGTVRLWSLADPAEPRLDTREVAEKGVRSIAFRPDGHQLACGGSDGRLRTLPLVGHRVGPPVEAHEGSVNALVYLPGNLLATGGSDGRLRLWEAERLESRGELAGPGEKKEVLALAVHAEAGRLASAGEDGLIRLWDVATGDCVKVLPGHTGAVRSLDFSADGLTLLSGGDDQSVRLWSLVDGNCIRRLIGHVEVVWVVAWSPDGRCLASGHDDHRVRVWDAETGACLHTFEGHSQWVQGLAWSPDGQRLASASADTTVRLWDVETGKCRELRDHSGWVVSVSWSLDGGLLASGSRDGTVRLWDPWSGRCVDVLRGHRSWVVSVSWSPDGMQLATAGVDGDICLWDMDELTEAGRLRGHTAWIGGLDFHPGGRLLASGSADGTVRIWDLDDGGAPRPPLTGHESWIWSVAWSPDGERLASGSQDETLRLWTVADGTCRILRTPRPYEGMSIRGATGLTEAQRGILCRLGAVDDPA